VLAADVPTDQPIQLYRLSDVMLDIHDNVRKPIRSTMPEPFIIHGFIEE
jgi:hypothetical protein